MAHITEESLKLSPSALVVLYELDLTDLGDNVYYFYAGDSEQYQNIVWQGNTYSAIPIEVEGFDISTEGVIATPKVRVANVYGTIAALARDFDDLINAKFTRRRTMLKYLDAVNFTGGNPDADPTVYYPDDVFFVARKSVENKLLVEFELSSPWDVEGVQLPKRQIIKNLCYWKYKGTECGYSGGPVADIYDNATADPQQDDCSRSITGCTFRFGGGPKPFGGFPAAGFVRK